MQFLNPTGSGMYWNLVVPCSLAVSRPTLPYPRILPKSDCSWKMLLILSSGASKECTVKTPSCFTTRRLVMMYSSRRRDSISQPSTARGNAMNRSGHAPNWYASVPTIAAEATFRRRAFASTTQDWQVSRATFSPGRSWSLENVIVVSVVRSLLAARAHNDDVRRGGAARIEQGAIE